MPNKPEAFPPAKLETDIFDGEEFARTETGRGVEGRASSVEGLGRARGGEGRESRALSEQEESSVEGPESSAEAAAVERPVSRGERLMS
jgi:hypothetical protein